MKKGLIFIVLNPIKESKKNEIKGFFKGLGKVIIGLIVSPFVVVLKIFHSLITGTKKPLNLTQFNFRKF